MATISTINETSRARAGTHARLSPRHHLLEKGRAMAISQSIPTHAESQPVIYKSVSGFPGYRIGSDGSVWTCLERSGYGKWKPGSVWRLRKPSMTPCGYLEVRLSSDGNESHRLIHRLVLEAFIGPCPDGMEGCHFPDPDRTNNAIHNLRWATPVENAKDREHHGRTRRGDTSGTAKLTSANVIEIRRRLSEGEQQTTLAREFGVHKTTVSLIATRKKWKHI